MTINRKSPKFFVKDFEMNPTWRNELRNFLIQYDCAKHISPDSPPVNMNDEDLDINPMKT